MADSKADKLSPAVVSDPSGGSSSSSNALSALSSLTSLTLSCVTLFGLGNGLRSLSVLTALQELAIDESVKVPGAKVQQQQQQLADVISQDAVQGAPFKQLCLQPLTQLTRLEVLTWHFAKGVVAPFSTLQQLQELSLAGSLHDSWAGLLAGLPASLKQLDFDWRGKQDLRIDSVPGHMLFTNLTALQALKVSFNDDCDDTGRVEPLLLSNMQQLQVLFLNQLSSNANSSLLQVMPRLTSLQDMEIGCHAVEPLPLSEAAR
jgi:hypothetical protein